MKKILRFIIMFILSGFVFGLVFSNFFSFSFDPILGKIYDHASLDARQNFLNNIDSTCKLMKLKSNNPEVELQVDPRIDQEELLKICRKNLKERELFIEFTKSQMVNIDVVLKNYPVIGIYSNILNSSHDTITTFIILIPAFLILLFLVEKNVYDFLRSIGKFLLTTSLIFLFIYMLPKVIMYFVNIDTSFLLEVNTGSTMVIGEKEVLLTLFPIILNEIFDEKMLVYGGFMFIISVSILLVLYIKNKSTKSQII